MSCGKLSKSDRDVIRRVSLGCASEADRRRWVILDDEAQAARNAKAIGLKLAGHAARVSQELILRVLLRTPAPV